MMNFKRPFFYRLHCGIIGVLVFFSAQVKADETFAGSQLVPIPEWSEKVAFVMSDEGSRGSKWFDEWYGLAVSISKVLPVRIYTHPVLIQDLKKRFAGIQNIELVNRKEFSSTVWTRDFSPFWLRNIYDRSISLVDAPYPKPGNLLPLQIASEYGLKLLTVPADNKYMLQGGNFSADDEQNCFMTDFNLKFLHVGYDELARWMGCKQNVFLQPLPDEKTHHVDLFMMVLPHKQVLMSEYLDSKDKIYQDTMEVNYSLMKNLGYSVIKIPAHYAGNSIHLSYTNSATAKNVFFVPQYGTKIDADAVSVYESVGGRVVKIPASNIIKGGGSVHCATSYIYNTSF